MTRSIILWILALLITLASAYYQRITGPTHPMKGTSHVGESTVAWMLERSHGGDGDQPVSLTVHDAAVSGTLIWRRLNSDDPWMRVPMQRNGDTLTAAIPHQPPAGKVQYRIELMTSTTTVMIPASGEPVVTRFKGDVPAGVLVPHIIMIFLAMLFSTRAGIEALWRAGRPRTQAIWTTVLMIGGGLIFGPMVQKYAFGAYWTGFPYGTDLTDNKTLIAFIAWALALAAVWNPRALVQHPARRWAVVAAAVVTLIVFLIPHSMWGSELKHTKAGTAQAGMAQTGTAQTGMAQASTAQAGTAQAGMAQTGTAQAGTVQRLHTDALIVWSTGDDMHAVV